MVNRITCFLRTLTERQNLFILLAITFGVRLYAVLMAKGIAYDGASYGFMARDFLKGQFEKGLSTPFHPLYPFLISLISPGSASVEIAGRTISIIFGTLTLLPVFYLVKETLGQKEAYYSGLFYSFHSYLVTYSGMLLSEATYWGLLSLSIYFFWMGMKRRRVLWVIVSGALLGLAYLTRPEGIGYLFALLIWIVLYDGIRKAWLRKFVFMGSLILPCFIFSVPYVIFIHQETGQWAVSKKGLAIQSQLLTWVEEESDRPEERTTQGAKPEGEHSRILGAAKNIVQFIPSTTYRYLRAYHFALWIFLFFGLIRTRVEEMKGELFLASLVLFHLVSLSTFTNSTIRFSIPLIPISLFWAGAGVSEIGERFKRRNIAKPGNWVFVLIILSLVVQLPQILKPERTHRADQKIVGLWLRENTPKDAVIMSNSPIEAFYAEREFVFLPIGVPMGGIPGKSYREIIRFARESRIHYILVNQHTHEMNPDLERSIRPADLREFYRYATKDANVIIVYEVMD